MSESINGPAMSYHLAITGLDEAVAAATVQPKHADLLARLQRLPAVAGIRLITHRGDAWLQKRQVVTAGGDVVADDHRAWLKSELDRDGGHVRATVNRLRTLGHRLTECAIDTLYLVQDRGGAQDDFVQIEINVEDEVADRRLFDERGSGWRRLETLRDLEEAAEDGDRLEGEARVRVRPPRYRLRRVFDAGAFLREAETLALAKRAEERARIVEVSTNGGPPRLTTVGALSNEPGPYVWPGRRLIDDWTRSSAGRAGRRLCKHWALQISDYTSPKGERSMSAIPLWTHTRKMAAIERRPKSVYDLFGKLEAIDRRVDVPFGWYFYMLHGNLVRNWVGEAVLQAAEAGTIVLPEHDYQVLKRRQRWPYGF